MSPEPAESRREAILQAAFVQFMRYGFRRTSMEDIARETGVSRASLYTHFANKEEIFHSLSAGLHEEALAAAEQALKAEAPLPRRVQAALEAKMGRFLDIMHGSPHGAELTDESSRLCGDLAASTDARLRKLLADALRAGARTGEIDLAAAGMNANSAAELLSLSATGLKSGASDSDAFRARLARLIRVFFGGVAGTDA
jgi:AcrR family transcriptional regulator